VEVSLTGGSPVSTEPELLGTIPTAFATPASWAERNTSHRDRTKGEEMLAAMGLGILGTILLVVLAIAVVLWLVRRA
jgi:hypothetical protein